MVEFFVGITLLAYTGITILAYRHPREYRPLALGLLVALTFIILALIIWDSATVNAYKKLQEFIQPSKLSESVTLLENLLMYKHWQVWALFGTSLYLAFLFFFLPKEKSKQEKTNQQ